MIPRVTYSLVAGSLALALCLAACGGGGGSAGTVDSVATQPAALVGSGANNSVLGIYRGSATSVIEDEDLSGRIVGARRFQTPVRVDISPVAASGGLIELNPFRLVITTDPGTRFGQEGQLSIKSSVLASVDTIPGRMLGDLLLQFWELTFDRTTLVGRLINTHQAESAASANALFSNTIFAPPDFVLLSECPMRVGTALRGTLDGSQVTLRVEGTVVCAFGTPQPKQFSFDIRALRASQ